MQRVSAKKLVGFLFSLAAADIANSQDRSAEIQSAIAECRAAVQDRRLDVIRDKVPLSGEANGLPSAPQRKPNATEVEALRLFHAVQVRCSMAFAERARGAKLDSPLMLGPYAHERLSGLVLLTDGYTTYADYARWRKAISDKAVRDATEKATRDQDTLRRDKR